MIVDEIDPNYPATLSKALVSDYLRGKLGFDGMIMTDAMRMKAIQDNYGTGAESRRVVILRCCAVISAISGRGMMLFLLQSRTAKFLKKQLIPAFCGY